MKEKNLVELEIKKTLRTVAETDEKVFQCEIVRYDSQKECIYLLLKSGELPELSLDAVYECRIDANDGKVLCDGCVKQRYQNEIGRILEFQIENGFYKINLKSVDKQEA